MTVALAVVITGPAEAATSDAPPGTQPMIHSAVDAYGIVGISAQPEDAWSRGRDVGGPGGYGYTFIDSNEAAGPTYSWINLTSGGTTINFADNNGEENISPTAYTYRFYGKTYSAFRVGCNGGLLVGDQSSHVSANNQELPQVTHAPPSIFPFWDDLDDRAGSIWEVLWSEFASCPHPHSSEPCLVVEWYALPHYNEIGNTTFELVLFTGGDILFQYADVYFGNMFYDYGVSATVGIEDDNQNLPDSADWFLQYSFDEASLSSGLAILFQPPEVFLDGFESGDKGAWQ